MKFWKKSFFYWLKKSVEPSRIRGKRSHTRPKSCSLQFLGGFNIMTYHSILSFSNTLTDVVRSILYSVRRIFNKSMPQYCVILWWKFGTAVNRSLFLVPLNVSLTFENFWFLSKWSDHWVTERMRIKVSGDRQKIKIRSAPGTSKCCPRISSDNVFILLNTERNGKVQRVRRKSDFLNQVFVDLDSS